jgi:hypothetical protein
VPVGRAGLALLPNTLECRKAKGLTPSGRRPSRHLVGSFHDTGDWVLEERPQETTEALEKFL